ncbi:TolC family protein [Deinococcus budaensis]|uniref:Outer membrane protein TolC n=1 Tax=Deinococcus budaensis TaxID=1665626 RepID=A0A7W8LQB1_9DEIO|nr:TolC family protein [Deinococcus budaensis]MBB5234559.1 outer membrane protein TolC [Deinococcus budaensis]
MHAPPLRPLLLLLSLALLASPLAAAQGGAAPSAAPPVPSAAPSPLPPLTLAETLTRLRGSPGWRSAELQARGAALALESARARAGLNVSLGVDLTAVRVPLASGDTTLGATLSAQASASVLPWSPALAAVASAERALARAGAEARASQLGLLVNAVGAYWNARSAAAALILAEAQATLAARQAEVAQAQRAAGVLSAEGLLARQGALTDAEAALREARTDVDLAARALANLLGGPVTLPVDPAAFGPLPAAPGDPGPAEPLVARALGGRPEVQRAAGDLADAQAQRRAAELDARLPDLSAGVQVGELAGAQGAAGRVIGGSLDFKSGVLAGQVSVPLTTAPTSPSPGQTPGGQSPTPARPTGVALSLSGRLPVVGGGKGVALASAGVGVEGAQLALDAARRSVDLDVRQRLADLGTARDALTRQRGALARAEAALATARARLEAGLVTALDVQAAELAAQQARLAADAALIQAHLASLRLAQATTDLDPTLLSLPPVPAPPEARP